MDTKKFLQLVVPEGQLLGLTRRWVINGENAMSNHPVRTHDDLATAVLGLDAKGVDVWYALASFVEDAKYMKDGKKLRLHRKQKLVDRLKSIWLDIDFKDCPAKELVPKFRTFVHKSGLPKPSLIVNSGGGLHIYWCLSKSLSPSEWVPLAEGLKQLCKEYDLPADHVCTSDQARVLRPVGTHNHKYNPPREVRLLSGTQECYDYETLLAVMPALNVSALPSHLRGRGKGSNEYANTGTHREVNTKQVIQKCAVLRHVLATGGAEQSEPEWNATLLLLRFLPDGAKLVHPMSQGHIDYSASATANKWQQKLEADVTGPPMCSTLEQYGHTSRCQSCPIYKSKKAKTPLSLGYVTEEPQVAPTVTAPATQSVGAFVTSGHVCHTFPFGWRDVAGNDGIEKKVYDKDAQEWVWEPVLKRTWRLKEAQRAVDTGQTTIRVEAAQVTGRRIEIDIPGAFIAGGPDLYKLLGEHGAPLLNRERPFWTELMTTWLAELQKQNAELDTVERYGWVRDPDPDNPKITGFSAGRTTYMHDGKDKETVRIKREHEQVGKLYYPMGTLAKWQEAAKYITDQNNPAFTAILASAFAAPLITFAELPGAVLTIVSTESGIGKTSAMRVAQAVWGQATKAMNSTRDTSLSVTKKVGFLNNLPAYWDEIRGNQALDSFYDVAFDIAQGKEKTRLNQSAQLREVHDWQTMVIAASNDSLFDYMAQKSGMSDAAIARTFEIVIDSATVTPDLNATPLFGALDLNYGKAGQIYAEHLARNHPRVAARVEKRLAQTRAWAVTGGERFWCAIIATLIVGAEEANRCGVTDINLVTLAEFLKNNLVRLRGRTGLAKSVTSPRELVGDYTQHFQTGELVVDRFPKRGERNYTPNILKIPKSGLMYVRAGNTIRFRKNDFITWLRQSKNLQFSTVQPEMVKDLSMTESSSALGLGTPHQLVKNAVLEVFMGP